jgi:hypothetical protein
LLTALLPESLWNPQHISKVIDQPDVKESLVIWLKENALFRGQTPQSCAQQLIYQLDDAQKTLATREKIVDYKNGLRKTPQSYIPVKDWILQAALYSSAFELCSNSDGFNMASHQSEKVFADLEARYNGLVSGSIVSPFLKTSAKNHYIHDTEKLIKTLQLYISSLPCSTIERATPPEMKFYRDPEVYHKNFLLFFQNRILLLRLMRFDGIRDARDISQAMQQLLDVFRDQVDFLSGKE